MCQWTVYILKCGDGSFYTGISNDLAKRLLDHEAGTGAKYTRGRGPFVVVYTEPHEGRSEASKREFLIKKLTRLEKESLIQSTPCIGL